MQLRPLALRLGLLFFAVPMVAAVTITDASAADAVEPSFAHLDVTVKSEGASVHMVGAHVEWNGSAVLETQEAEHAHQVRLQLVRSADGKSVSLALRYHRDGAEVVTKKSVDATLTEPVRIASADGKTEIVVVVAPEPARKIEVDDSDDPLAGV
jgi:hypothetical protein